jgi:hypothetical protein
MKEENGMSPSAEQLGHTVPPPEEPLREHLRIVNHEAPEGPFLNEPDFAQPYNYSLQDLLRLFTPAEIIEVEKAQHFTQSHEDFSSSLQELGEDFMKRFQALANNYGEYDEVIEDAIASDLVVQELKHQLQRLKGRDVPVIKQGIVRNMRIRRSTAAYLEALRHS